MDSSQHLFNNFEKTTTINLHLWPFYLCIFLFTYFIDYSQKNVKILQYQEDSSLIYKRLIYKWLNNNNRSIIELHLNKMCLISNL